MSLIFVLLRRLRWDVCPWNLFYTWGNPWLHPENGQTRSFHCECACVLVNPKVNLVNAWGLALLLISTCLDVLFLNFKKKKPRRMKTTLGARCCCFCAIQAILSHFLSSHSRQDQNTHAPLWRGSDCLWLAALFSACHASPPGLWWTDGSLSGWPSITSLGLGATPAWMAYP